MSSNDVEAGPARPCSADRVASSAIAEYNLLPRHGKPVTRDNGVPEWTVLSAIFLSTPDRLIPISLATGVKVLPANRLPPLGDVVHDSHAEILVRRGMIRWLLSEAAKVVKGQGNEGVLEYTESRMGFRDGVETWLYISALPCGDASMLQTAAYQPVEMAFLKSSTNGDTYLNAPGRTLRGRNGYESLGALRTKPGRADSIPSICMSCSDKIASWSTLGMQGALLAGCFDPVWIGHVVVGGVEEVPPEGARLEEGIGWRAKIKKELERALYGRLTSLQGRLPSPYQLRRPEIHLTSVIFPYSKSALPCPPSIESAPSVLSVSYIPSLSSAPEVLFNGCRQGGAWKLPGDVPVPSKSRSRLCKLEILRAYWDFRMILHEIDKTRWPLPASDSTHYALKHSPDSVYQETKAILRGRPGAWTESTLDFPTCGAFAMTAGGDETPFRGWLYLPVAMEILYEAPLPHSGFSAQPDPSRAKPRPLSEAEDEEEDAGEAAADQEEPKQKKKRVTKQRQSLSEKQIGTTIFPISRIKRIIKADEELDMMTGEACFMVAVAAEYFIKHFMEEGYTKARLEKRRIVNYKDMAAVVARSEEFDFLRDVIPSPIPMSEALERRKQKMLADDNPTLHEDAMLLPGDVGDDLPPLIPSTNPLFPNAIVKKPPNTHAKSTLSKQTQEKEKKGLTTPRVVTGKNAPSTPHSLLTRGSARKSVFGLEGDTPEVEVEVERDVDMGMEERKESEPIRSSVGAGAESEEEREERDDEDTLG
ncbi:MAG: hypothetical protein TREMPRED_001391 [Tremellales sp. Tagirdzhanova-0007]|nr:MAG: hypothetical protein TREMPRED_001391 [Tremellales sp. Tagirdzhanova-0007]